MLRSRTSVALTLCVACMPAARAQGRPFADWPQGGNAGRDLACAFHVDLDPGPGILDFRCGTRTYDTHRGVDATLRSFAEMDIGDGVPVFAMLDGIVIQVQEGFPDRNKPPNPSPNLVSIDHGNIRTTYLHLRNGSLTAAGMSLGSHVVAGQQIGSTGNAGRSAWPHLHFGTQLFREGVWSHVEPFTGDRSADAQPVDRGRYRPERSGAHASTSPTPRPRCSQISLWRAEPPFRHALRLVDAGVSGTDPATALPPPEPQPTGGWIAPAAGVVHAWGTLVNVSLTHPTIIRYRVMSGNQVVADETHSIAPTEIGPIPFGEALEVPALAPGNWIVRIDVHGTLQIDLPFLVGADPGNRPPRTPLGVTLDPAAPTSDDAILYCRVTTPLLNDPDYDVVRYTYEWRVDGQVVRTTTHAGEADAIPGRLAAGQSVTCTVTVDDGRGGTAGTFPTTATVRAPADDDGEWTEAECARPGLLGYPRLRPRRATPEGFALSHAAPRRPVLWTLALGRDRPGCALGQTLVQHVSRTDGHGRADWQPHPPQGLPTRHFAVQAHVFDPTAQSGLAASGILRRRGR